MKVFGKAKSQQQGWLPACLLGSCVSKWLVLQGSKVAGGRLAAGLRPAALSLVLSIWQAAAAADTCRDKCTDAREGGEAHHYSTGCVIWRHICAVTIGCKSSTQRLRCCLSHCSRRPPCCAWAACCGCRAVWCSPRAVQWGPRAARTGLRIGA